MAVLKLPYAEGEPIACSGPIVLLAAPRPYSPNREKSVRRLGEPALLKRLQARVEAVGGRAEER